VKALSVLALGLLTTWSGIARAEVIRGTVLEDHSGAAVPAASVRLKTAAGVTVKEIETDRSGRFEVSDVAAGMYQVSITKANYASLNARLAAGNTPVASPVLRLIRYGVISGHITSPRVGGAVVVIEQVPNNMIPRTYSGTIDAAGEFRVFGIPPGRYVLAAPFNSANTIPGVARGFALYPTHARPLEFEIAGGEQYEANDFVVQRGGTSTISGKISSPAGPQTYTLAIVPSEYPSIRVQLTLTAMDGTFKLDNFHPGAYELYASGPVMRPSLFAHVHLDLHSQTIENMDIRLEPGRPVEFMLPLDNPNPDCSPDGTLTLQSLGSWPLVRDQKIAMHITPQQTPIRIENIGPTLFAVTAQSTTGGCTGVTDRLFDMTGDVPPRRVIMGFQPPSVIHGAAPAASVVILRDVTPGREAPVQAAFPTSSGFRFEGLAPGQYCVAKRSATDVTPRWTSESGCDNVVEVAPGESKGL
jgi:hypothetical protein